MLVAAAVLALAVASVAAGQFRGRRYMTFEDNAPPPTEFIVARFKYGTNGAIGHMGWSHNYPDAEMNLNEFIGRTTKIHVEDPSYRLLELSNPEIFNYPFAYVSEPGEMELTDAEVVNLREYIERGGFILIDDFDTWHMDNLREEMLRVFPDRVSGAGAIGGILTALESTTADRVIVIACDMPFLVTGLLQALLVLAESGDGAWVRTGRGPEPLVACYRQQARTSIREAIESGHLRAAELDQVLTLRELTQLRVGDVIELPSEIVDQTIVALNNIPKFTGTVGLDSDRVVVKLVKKISPENSTHGKHSG